LESSSGCGWFNWCGFAQSKDDVLPFEKDYKEFWCSTHLLMTGFYKGIPSSSFYNDTTVALRDDRFIRFYKELVHVKGATVDIFSWNGNDSLQFLLSSKFIVQLEDDDLRVNQAFLKHLLLNLSSYPLSLQDADTVSHSTPAIPTVRESTVDTRSSSCRPYRGDKKARQTARAEWELYAPHIAEAWGAPAPEQPPGSIRH